MMSGGTYKVVEGIKAGTTFDDFQLQVYTLKLNRILHSRTFQHAFQRMELFSRSPGSRR